MDALDDMRALLTQCGCHVRISGTREQWNAPVKRRAILIVDPACGKLRLCAERVGEYACGLPASLKGAIAHAPNCGGGCRPWGGRECIGGWSFEMDGEQYRKCRYGAFAFDTAISLEAVRDMLRMELHARGML